MKTIAAKLIVRLSAAAWSLSFSRKLWSLLVKMKELFGRSRQDTARLDLTGTDIDELNWRYYYYG